jgi:hypothetical protein
VGDEGDEAQELEYENKGIVYEDGEGVYRHKEPRYGQDGVYKPQEPDDDNNVRTFTPADYEVVEPPTPYKFSPMHLTPMYVPPSPFSTPTHPPSVHDIPLSIQHGHMTALKHVQDVHRFTHTDYNTREHACAGYDMAEPTPTHSLLSTSTPIPHAGNFPRSNQGGHMTMLQNCTSTFDDECEFTNTDNSTVKHQTDYQVPYSHPNHLLLVSPAAYHIQNACYTTTPYHASTYTPSHLPIPYTFPSMSNNKHDGVTTTFLDRLHRDCNEGMPNAIVYMKDLWDFTQDCQHEEAEWKADR